MVNLSQLIQISSRNQSVCFSLISIVLLPPSDRQHLKLSHVLHYCASYQVFVCMHVSKPSTAHKPARL